MPPKLKAKKAIPPQNFFPVNMGLIPAPDTIPINTRGTFVDLETGKKKRSQFRGFVVESGSMQNVYFWTFVNSHRTNEDMFRKLDAVKDSKAPPGYRSRWEFLVDPADIYSRGNLPAPAPAPVPAPEPRPEGGAGPVEGEGAVPNWFRRRNVPYNAAHNELVLPNATPEVSPVSTIGSLALSTNNENNVLALLNSPVVNKPTRKSRKGRNARKVTRRSRRS
jgi:hypothetical protein